MAIVRARGLVPPRVQGIVDDLGVPGALPAPWRLAVCEVEQGVILRFARGATDVAVEVWLDRADEARPCFARTRDFNVYYALFNRPTAGLDAAERALLERVLGAVRAQERSLPVLPRRDTPGGWAPVDGVPMRVREVEGERALVAEAPGMYYLNPYLGCMLGCRYCYGIGLTEFVRDLGALDATPWGRWLDVKVNAPELLARELPGLAPGTVRMSPLVTDPYQPVERRYRVTRRCLEVLRGTEFTPVVLTRSAVVLDDLPLLRAMPRLLVGVSVPTDDDRVRVAFEPAAPSIDVRVATLRGLRAAGLRTFAVVHPMLPMDPRRLAGLLAPHVEVVRVGPLAEKPQVAGIFREIGREDALDPRWEQENFAALSDAFTQAGIPVNPRFAPWDGFR
jgi:DNA repair photolyase